MSALNNFEKCLVFLKEKKRKAGEGSGAVVDGLRFGNQ